MDEREHEGLSLTEESVIATPPTDEERLAEQQAVSEKAIAQTAYLYYQVFSGGDGAAILQDLHEAYMERGSVDLDNPDPCLTAFREGERGVVLKIIALMKMGATNPNP